MRIEEVESALRAAALPRAPRSLRDRVVSEAKKELDSPRAPVFLRAPSAPIERLSLAGALIACAAVLCVVVFPPVRPSTKTPERLDELLACIRDPDAPGRPRAVLKLGEITGRKAMPLAASLLEDSDRDVRAAAAGLLCVGGAAEIGVPALLREGRGLTVLNLLRSPDLWKAMAGARVPDLSGRSAPDRIRAIGLGAGLEVLAARPATFDERRWAAERRTDAISPTMLAALEAALRFGDGSPGPYEVVFEPGKIRLLPRREAVQFWSEWWTPSAPKK